MKGDFCMTLVYPAIFHEEDGSFWVEFPDLKGCQSFGDTIAETMEGAKEALAGYAAVVLEEGKQLPAPTPIQNIKPEEHCFVSLIDAKPASTKRAVKKTLSIPAWLNDAAEAAHAPYSAILQEGLERYLHLA